MTVLIVVLQLIFLEGILSLDNAAVLGAMVMPLPDDRPIPWPDWLRQPAHRLDSLLGPQRAAALRVGLLGAYLGRGLMLVLATWVVDNPWLKVLGALYLIRLAAANLGLAAESAHDVHATTEGSRFWRVVLAVELADLAFSIDNVVAAAALSDRLPVVVLGVGLGILMMRFAAGVFSHLVEREPVLESAAYVLILNIGLELLLEELVGVHFGDLTKFATSAGTLALALLYVHWQPLHVFAPLLHAAAWLLGCANAAVEWAGRPIEAVLSLLVFRR
jgi:tellurite resistance protein TerC